MRLPYVDSTKTDEFLKLPREATVSGEGIILNRIFESTTRG